jgi:hypothetical protein
MMREYVLTILLIVLVSMSAASQGGGDAERIGKVKAAVARIGVGVKAPVQVKRFAKPKVNGIINQIGVDSFVVLSTDEGSVGTAITISYSEVVQLKGKGVDWRQGAIKAGMATGKALNVMRKILKGACLGCGIPL